MPIAATFGPAARVAALPAVAEQAADDGQHAAELEQGRQHAADLDRGLLVVPLGLRPWPGTAVAARPASRTRPAR